MTTALKALIKAQNEERALALLAESAALAERAAQLYMATDNHHMTARVRQAAKTIRNLRPTSPKRTAVQSESAYAYSQSAADTACGRD
jgi:hypothetical protein